MTDAQACVICGRPATKEVIAATEKHPVTAGPMCNKHANEAQRMARWVGKTAVLPLTHDDLYAYIERQRKSAEARREWAGPIVKRSTVKPGGLFGTPEISTEQQRARMNAIIRRVWK